jgi:hypothetical protein
VLEKRPSCARKSRVRFVIHQDHDPRKAGCSLNHDPGRKRWASHNRLESAARFPLSTAVHRPRSPKPNPEKNPGGWRASLVEAMEIGSEPLRSRREPPPSLGELQRRPSHSLAQKSGSDVVSRGRKTRFGLWTVSHASENPRVMTLKNHTV